MLNLFRPKRQTRPTPTSQKTLILWDIGSCVRQFEHARRVECCAVHVRRTAIVEACGLLQRIAVCRDLYGRGTILVNLHNALSTISVQAAGPATRKWHSATAMYHQARQLQGSWRNYKSLEVLNAFPSSPSLTQMESQSRSTQQTTGSNWYVGYVVCIHGAEMLRQWTLL